MTAGTITRMACSIIVHYIAFMETNVDCMQSDMALGLLAICSAHFSFGIKNFWEMTYMRLEIISKNSIGITPMSLS